MNAITLLEDDHKDLKKLLEKGDDTTERAVKTRAALLQEIAAKLTAHEKIEEDIFYPALKEAEEKWRQALGGSGRGISGADE